MSEPRKGNTWPQIPRPPLNPRRQSVPTRTPSKLVKEPLVRLTSLPVCYYTARCRVNSGPRGGKGGGVWWGWASLRRTIVDGKFHSARTLFAATFKFPSKGKAGRAAKRVKKKKNNTSVAYFTVARRVTGTRCTCWMVGQAGESREISWEADRRAESFPKLRAFRNFREPEEGRRKERVGFVKQVRFSQAKNLVREKPNCAFYHL